MDEEERAQDIRRFQALYDAHHGAVVAYARRRVARPVDAALPWLYGVARRVLANQRRGAQRRADLSARLRGQATAGTDLEGQIIAGDERGAVLTALSRLRPADQEILRLAVWEELPHRDIAGVVGCSESSVAVRLHRARTRLGREIGKEERRVGQERSGRRPEDHDR